MKYTFPANYGEDCIIVGIDKSLLPIIFGALRPLEHRFSWDTDEDYEQGYNAFAQLQAEMTGKCVSELVSSIDRLYRLLDTTFNGTQYTAGAPDPVTGEQLVTPAIPAAPPASTNAENAMRAHVGRLWQLAENSVNGRVWPAGAGVTGSPALQDTEGVRAVLRAMQGIIDAGWFGIGGQRATIADMVSSVRLGSDSDKQQTLNALDTIVGAGSSATIFNTVRSFFTDSADLGLEGGQIAVQLVAAMGQIISNKLMSDQLERVIQTLGGAGLVAPDDNILMALRGQVPATAERNIIDSLVAAITAGGSIDAAPIVAAIEAMRGEGPENTVKSVNESLWNIAGPAPGVSLTDLAALLQVDTGSVNWNVAGLLNSVRLSLLNSGGTDNIPALLTLLNNAVGAVPNESLELATVRGLLWALQRGAQVGQPPDGDVTAASSSSISSNGRRYVVWTDMATITETNDNTDLTPDIGWNDYYVYIQTDAPTCLINDNVEIAANSWVALDSFSSQTLNFSVDSSFSVRGYLRIPDVPGNVFYAVNGTVNGASEWQIQWPSIFNPLSTVGGYTRPNGFRPGNYNGWTFRVLTGSAVIDQWNNNSWLGQRTITLAGITLSVNTTSINIRSNNYFEVEVIAP